MAEEGFADDDALCDDEDLSVFSEDSASSEDYDSSDEGDNENQVHDERDEVAEMEKLAKKETWHVEAWKRIVVLMLLVATSLVISLTYVFMTRTTNDSLRKSLMSLTQSIEDNASFRFNSILFMLQSVSTLLTVHSADNSNEPFPFVTLADFESFTTRARGDATLFYTPLVDPNLLGAWNEYSVQRQGWISDSLNSYGLASGAVTDQYQVTPIPREVYRYDEVTVSNNITDANGNLIRVENSTTIVYSTERGTYKPEEFVNDTNYTFPIAPVWLMSPPPVNTSVINFNILSIVYGRDLFANVNKSRTLVTGPFGTNVLFDSILSQPLFGDVHHRSVVADLDDGHPISLMAYPVFSNLDTTNNATTLTGVVMALIPWDKFMEDLVPTGLDGIYCVVKNSCGQQYTYMLNGEVPVFLGEGDLHDIAFDDHLYTIDFVNFLSIAKNASAGAGDCFYSMAMYPPTDTLPGFYSNSPVVFTVIVSIAFTFMAFSFFMYDCVVQRKNNRLIGTAARSNAVVSSLFPSTVRDRLFCVDEPQNTPGVDDEAMGTNKRLQSFFAGANVNEPDQNDMVLKTKPIADMFANTTIMFADMVGFTAWSSVREPSQVFMLLERVYGAFDKIARRRRVFKVETIGDCYVAVTGLPTPRKDHAVVMARFAIDCLNIVQQLTKKLEVSLGPDTADLTVRIGLHSGAVTAGVLRGERSRFQLFGDAMHVAARMENLGQRGRIHVSQETADLLMNANKGHWLTLREDKITIKGKGEMQTYFVNMCVDHSISTSDSASNKSGGSKISKASSQGRNKVQRPSLPIKAADSETAGFKDRTDEEKLTRLINWNVDVLARLLKQIEATRGVHDETFGAFGVEQILQEEKSNNNNTITMNDHDENVTPLEQVKEIVNLPDFDPVAAKRHRSPDSIVLGDDVLRQLREFVTAISRTYRNNFFHNFEHASHVTMSVVKLMSRIVAPSDIDFIIDKTMSSEEQRNAMSLHDHTYGITSDPLTQFACVFSALIHDVDHTGVPNTQLVKENSAIAAFYKGKSVAEQNSVDIAWKILMEDRFAALRNAIYSDDSERKRFRQLVVNSVMATDIMDKDLKTLRNNRWDKAFYSEATAQDANPRDNINRKATIVIEHLIQASDIAHTMQHWHVYRKWNERFFQECYTAYKQGRAEADPSVNWYKGELGFYDFYIIPLAKKLKNCGVFGVSSDEYLNWAIKNRSEWEARGMEVVAEMMENLNKLDPKPWEAHA